MWHQWWANPNPDLDLNPDLTTFPNPAGFGFDLKIFKSVDLDLDLSFFESGGFGVEGFTGFGFEPCWICPPLVRERSGVFMSQNDVYWKWMYYFEHANIINIGFLFCLMSGQWKKDDSFCSDENEHSMFHEYTELILFDSI